MTIYHIPERKVESAIKSVLTNWATSNSVALLTRNLNQEVNEPFCLIASVKAEPEIDGNIGNWIVDVEITIRTNANGDDDGAIHDNLAGSLTDILLTASAGNENTGFMDLLNASSTSDLTVTWFEIGTRRQLTVDHSHITVMEMQIHMLPS